LIRDQKKSNINQFAKHDEMIVYIFKNQDIYRYVSQIQIADNFIVKKKKMLIQNYHNFKNLKQNC